jgi:hypothetical protein
MQTTTNKMELIGLLAKWLSSLNGGPPNGKNCKFSGSPYPI